MRLYSLVLAVALPALVACGESDPAPAPEAAPDAPSEPANAAPGPEATPDASDSAERTSDFSVTLDAANSSVKWTAIKNGDAPVAGKFSKLTGGLVLTAADLGATTGELTIDLSGIDSGVDLRDTRIAEAFFGVAPDVAKKATVTLSALLLEETTLEPGATTKGSAMVNLAFDSASVTLKAPVTVARVDANTWTVATEIDATLSIKELGFSDPLAALITLCAHQSVDDAVAITANLTFKAAE